MLKPINSDAYRILSGYFWRCHFFHVTLEDSQHHNISQLEGPPTLFCLVQVSGRGPARTKSTTSISHDLSAVMLLHVQWYLILIQISSNGDIDYHLFYYFLNGYKYWSFFGSAFYQLWNLIKFLSPIFSFSH